MRLLHTTTFILASFFDSSIPEYVILSHTWNEEEVSFQDIQDLSVASKLKGFSKIQKCCDQAVKDGFTWAWIDTCCIDKTSSAELSEAINSMFRWYKNSRICYAYLEDVKSKVTSIASSRWFTRGWTLQELIAPEAVEFYSADWIEIGTKRSLKEDISQITGIDAGILDGDTHLNRNIAQRMSWAANRKTSREEDRAYSLMGLFDINMSMLYGEGGKRAFIRLQEEIMKTTEDYTLFAWTGQKSLRGGLLARSPDHFESAYWYSDLEVNPRVEHDYMGIGIQNTRQIVNNPNESAPSLTNRGVRISLALRATTQDPGCYLAYLNCQRRSDKHMLCIYLRKVMADKPFHYTRVRPSTGISLGFIPPSSTDPFLHSPLYVTADPRLVRSLDLAPYLPPCLFYIRLEKRVWTPIRFSNYHPKSGFEDTLPWNWADGNGLRLERHPNHSRSNFAKSTGAVEIEFQTTTKFRVFFGTRSALPWCSIQEENNSLIFDSIDADVKSFIDDTTGGERGDSDRAQKVLVSGEVVSVSARRHLNGSEGAGPVYNLVISVNAAPLLEMS